MVFQRPLLSARSTAGVGSNHGEDLYGIQVGGNLLVVLLPAVVSRKPQNGCSGVGGMEESVFDLLDPKPFYSLKWT